MAKDLRTISPEERETLRGRAVKEVGKCHNISKVSRDLGINRQVLHSWLNKCNSLNSLDKDERGRPKQKLEKAHAGQIFDIMAYNYPTDLGVDSNFWSVSSARKLIHKTLGINSSAYLVRRWLVDWGFFKRRNTKLLGKSSVASKGLSVQKFADQCNMPCYIYWRSYVRVSKGHHPFQCVSSKRGDIRFVSMGVRQTSVFLNKLQEVARRNIVVVCDEYCRLYQYDLVDISKSVVMFRISSNGKLIGLGSSRAKMAR